MLKPALELADTGKMTPAAALDDRAALVVGEEIELSALHLGQFDLEQLDLGQLELGEPRGPLPTGDPVALGQCRPFWG